MSLSLIFMTQNPLPIARRPASNQPAVTCKPHRSVCPVAKGNVTLVDLAYVVTPSHSLIFHGMSHHFPTCPLDMFLPPNEQPHLQFPGVISLTGSGGRGGLSRWPFRMPFFVVRLTERISLLSSKNSSCAFFSRFSTFLVRSKSNSSRRAIDALVSCWDPMVPGCRLVYGGRGPVLLDVVVVRRT